ncbi:hypothetical protein [Amycolatopsis pigmentata]|uniref:DNA segregation ATPase FtsK/SpoIIIE, S-DNA-T family n=1 Tax=Amycolatopsis pigmentata TaxID=450801 RepID=A0ABW5G2Y8_9PSEU
MTDDQKKTRSSNVVPFKGRGAGDDWSAAGDALEGDVLTPEQYDEIQREKELARYAEYRRSAETAVQHISYVKDGAKTVALRIWEAKSQSRYQRVMDELERAKDWDRLDLWECKVEQAKKARHDRRMDRIKHRGDMLKAAATRITLVIVALILLGGILAIAGQDPALILAPLMAIIHTITWTYWLVTSFFLVITAAVIAGVLMWLWSLGRRRDKASAAGWTDAAKINEATKEGTVVTPDGIAAALRYLGIPRLAQAITKEGWVPSFDLIPIREGQGVFKGYRTIFDLPAGVTPLMVANQADVLAKNLHRNPVEVWPSDDGKRKGGRAGFVNLYVADSGVMDKPTPPYPLLHEGTADVFAGVPVGITQRGDTVVFVLFGGNFVFGGQPGQGKSNAARVVMLGAALDPLAELRVHVFANNGDFDAYEPRLALYVKGATPEHVEMATEHLRELYEEVGRREQRLAEIGAKKATRAIAEKHPDLRPIVTLFSECHELFSKSDDAAELAVDVVKRGRKTGIICGFDTQSSRANAIPSQLVENVGINGCFAVKTWRSNDGFLGDGSFAAGIRATELRFNVDRGTMVATGVSEELFEIVRTFFVEVNDDTGYDAAAEVIDRAMGTVADGTPIQGDRPAPGVAEEHRDLLEDVAEVLGAGEPIPAAQVADSLKAKWPRWAPYRPLTAKSLAARLEREYGVKVPKTGNRNPIDPVTVGKRLAELATGDLDDE